MSDVQIEVLLVVVSPNLRVAGESRVLLEEVDGQLRIPSTLLGEQETGRETAASLLFDLTGHREVTRSGWLTLKSCPLKDSPSRLLNGTRVLSLPFACMLPMDVTPCKRGLWYPLAETMTREVHLDHRQIVMDACNTL